MDKQTNKDNPVAVIICPECSSKMHRMGKVWSGRHQVQRYRCPKCGRTTIKHPDNEGKS